MFPTLDGELTVYKTSQANLLVNDAVLEVSPGFAYMIAGVTNPVIVIDLTDYHASSKYV